MKVINQGECNKPWTGFKAKCRECGSVLKLENSDNPKLIKDFRDGDYYEINCPTCENTLTLNAQMVRNISLQGSLT